MAGNTNTYIGGAMVQEKNNNYEINYYYDASGDVASIGYKASGSSAETHYFFTRNLQGDVIGIYNSANSAYVGWYTYDSWGMIKSTVQASMGSDPNGIMAKNPIRYRGYYRDDESGFYYLQTRYYDPEVKRFINADGLISTGQGVMGYNMYAYCQNNPVTFVDPTGMCSYLAPTYVIRIDCKMTSCASSSKYIKPTSFSGAQGQAIVYSSPKPAASSSSSALKSNPAAVVWNGNAASSYAKESDASVIARMLYGEDHSTTAEHLWILENRRLAGNYGGATYRELVLANGQFDAMGDPRSLNPASHFGDPDEKLAWDNCVDMAYLLLEKGIGSIPKPPGNFNYTYTNATSESFKRQYPDGVEYGGTWFYNR